MFRYACIIVFLLVYCPLAVLPFLRAEGMMHRTATDLYGMLLLLPAGCIPFLPSKKISINAADVLFFCFLMICCIKPGLKFDLSHCMQIASLMLGYTAFRMFPRKAISGLLAIMMATCVWQSVYGYLQYTEYFESLHPLHRITGSFDNPSHLASFLSSGTVIAVGMLLFPEQFSPLVPFKKERLFRAFAGIGAAWLVFVLALTEARAAWTGVSVAVLYLLYLRGKQRIKEIRIPRIGIIVGIISIVFFASAVGYTLYRYKKDSADGRILIWKITAEMIGRRPITGNGSDAFRSDYMYAQATYFAERPDAPERMLAGNTTRPFNEYLRIWYEHGLVGLLLLVAALYLVMCSPTRSTSPALKAALAAGAVICCFSYPLEIWSIKMYLLAMFALQAKSLPPVRTMFRVFPIRCIYAVCWCGTVIMILFYANHVHRCRTVSTIDRQKTGNVADIFIASYPVLCNNNEYLSAYIRILSREEQYEEALRQKKKLAQLSPSSEVFCDMGDLYVLKKQYAEAEKRYRTARDMKPAAFVPLLRLMKLYAETGQKGKAKGIAVEIIRQPIKVKTNVTDKIKKEALELLINKTK